MIPLYNYVSAFNEGKLRPGFRIEGQLFVLTSTKPVFNYMILTGSCCSDHFTSHGKKYVTLASNQKAYRYNNVVGGHISLDVKRFEAKFKVNLLDYLTTNTHNMTKLSAFAVVNGFFILDNPSILGFEGDAAKVAMGLTKDGVPMEQSIEDAIRWVNATEKSPAALDWAKKFHATALPLARTELVAELTKLYGAESAATYNELIEDTAIPEMVAIVVNYLANPQDADSLEQITSAFGDPTVGVTVAEPAQGIEIDPQALQSVIAQNQASITNGVPAEVLIEEPAAGEGELTIQPNLDLPAQPGTFQEGARELLDLAASALDKRLADALAVKKTVDSNFEDAVNDARDFNQKAMSALEKMLEAPARASEPALLAETV